jgi:hypothetical protein
MLFERPERASDRQLRQFAAALVVFTLLVVSRQWWRHGSVGPVAEAVSAVALVLGALGLLSPRRIEWLFKTLTAVTWPVGAVVSELMLVILYFAVVTPVGLLLRLAGRDPLSRDIDRSAATYWVAHKRSDDQSRYFRQS